MVIRLRVCLDPLLFCRDFTIIDAKFLNAVTRRLASDAGISYNPPRRHAIPSRPRFEAFEHTADAGIVARGATLQELFQAAAEGMFSLMVDPAGVQEREQRQIEAAGRDLEGLLVAWLSDLLYFVDAAELLFRRFEIDEFSETHLRGRAFGEKIDRERHELRSGVKAVTRHMLEVAQEDGGFRAKILFDI